MFLSEASFFSDEFHSSGICVEWSKRGKEGYVNTSIDNIKNLNSIISADCPPYQSSDR